MDFENHTQSPASLLRSGGPGTRMYGSLITRTRYRLSEAGILARPPAELALTDMRPERLETPYGIFEPDDFFPRRGTDVIVLGNAVSPEPVTEMTVRVTAGPYRVVISVIGDRVWERRADGTLVPGPPAAFTSMPMRYENAFGGVAKNEYGNLPDANNPVGKGFYLNEGDALGQPLPNLEDPAQRIRAWGEHPDVVGLGPYSSAWGLRLAKVVTVDPATQEVAIDFEKGLYDRAHPSLSGQRLGAGERITGEGLSLRGPVAFLVPTCPFAVEVILGATTTRLAPVLEEVLVDVDAGLVDLTYRKLFKYEMVPNQRRRTLLVSAKEGQSLP